MTLSPVVERARVCALGAGWQGATRPQAHACNEEQRGQRVSRACTRVRSALTYWVNAMRRQGLNLHRIVP